MLVWLIMKFFPEISDRIPYYQWRNLIACIFISAYGMLLSFPFQGYALLSIIFSTLSVIAGFYLAWMIWQTSSNQKHLVSVLFLRAGIIYMILSSLGPFATGPLVVMGKTTTNLYSDVIYFYLHFQYNGWFCFLILAVIMKLLEKQGILKQGKRIFLLFNLSCLPAFFLSTLWHHPGLVFNIIGGFAGLTQLAAMYYLIKDCKNLKFENPFLNSLFRFILAALVLKLVLQFLSAFPLIADLAFQNRGFIIAYLHLVLLGFISLSAILFLFSSEIGLVNHQMKSAILVFIFSFVTTELLLVLQPIAGLMKFSIPFYPQILFSLSIFYPLSVLWMVIIIGKHLFRLSPQFA
jgi:hypothetical protein